MTAILFRWLGAVQKEEEEKKKEKKNLRRSRRKPRGKTTFVILKHN